MDIQFLYLSKTVKYDLKKTCNFFWGVLRRKSPNLSENYLLYSLLFVSET